jgi:hypothetical protein
MEMYVVDREMVGTEQAYWMEVGHSKDANGNSCTGKYSSRGRFQISQNDFCDARSTQPMEMDMDAAKSHQHEMEDKLDKWHSVGTETITVPAGTFSCEHWTNDDSKGDVWASSKISPMGLVKSVEDGRTMVLVKTISDAKSKITGTPVKFDPKMMMQQRMQQHQQQQNP